MHWRTASFIGLLVVFTIWLGWRYFTRPQGGWFPESTPVVVATPLPTTTPQPATKEDIAKLLAVPVTITNAKISTTSGTLEFIAEHEPGFITLFGENIATRSARNVLQVVRDQVEEMPLVAVDHEGGRVQRLSGAGFTRLPSFQQVCAQESGDRKALFEKSAFELQQVGVDIIFAPMVDLAKNHPVLRDRICSDDSTIITAVAEELIIEYRKKGILPVLKHYPGIGDTQKDLHADIDAVLNAPSELPVFQSLFKIFPRVGVMTAHVLVKDLSEEAPCSLNEKCVDILKRDAPEALIFTDALEMDSARTGFDLVTQKSLIRVSREALLAGNHVLVYGRDVTPAELEKVLETLSIEYGTNEVLRQKIDEALQHVRTTKRDVFSQ